MDNGSKQSDTREALWGAPHRPSRRWERWLWFGAGANKELLEHCPQSDRVKYQGLGGVVWATGILAYVSGSYAFYTVFSPKGDAAPKGVHVMTLLFALIFGTIWSGIIFNLDRFIVSSAGKGDGTEKITFGELVAAAPRIAMAVIIGLCIAKPLELHILKPEIDLELKRRQQAQAAGLNKMIEDQTSALVAERRAAIARNEDELSGSRTYFETRRLEIQAQRKSIQDEAEGLSANKQKGCGPACLEKKNNLDIMAKELEHDQTEAQTANRRLEEEIARAKQEITVAEKKRDGEKENNRKDAAATDGMMVRIQISHEIGGLIPLFLTLLLLMIEASPIFFKMMLTKGPYDYLTEHEKKMQVARAGIVPDGKQFLETRKVRSWFFFEREETVKVCFDRSLSAERVLHELELKLEDEKQLSTAVHEEFRRTKLEEIRSAPTRFFGESTPAPRERSSAAE